jgi:hypothetical protein
VADTLKVLAQSAPVAGTLTDAYTVPGSASAVLSSFVACNQSNLDTTFRISIAVAGAADAPAQYLYYDLPLYAKDSYKDVLGITLAATDVVRVYSGNGATSFTFFGVQVT